MDQNKLTSTDKKFLRSQAHELEPVVRIGKNGLTDSVLVEIENKISEMALIKVKASVLKEDWDSLLEALSVKAKCEIVGSVGSVIILYRHGIKPLSASAYEK